MYTLYQFPISHYCEKARWALEFKKIDYEIKNLIPGPHRAVLKKLNASSSVPVLQTERQIIQGSAQIIDYLDAEHKYPLLTPSGAEHASIAHEWERFADNNIGVPLRRLFYFYVLQNRKLATSLLTAGGPWWGRSLYLFIFPTLRRLMRQGMSIDAAGAESARLMLDQAFTQIEDKLKDKRYLAGEIFSRADLAVSALLAPIWTTQAELPPELAEINATWQQRPLIKWAQHVYHTHRHQIPH